MAASPTDEIDWKVFRKLRVALLERECQKIIGELESLGHSPDKTWHERYLAVVQHLRERQRDIADAFDDARRSTMFRQLLFMRTRDMITDEDLKPFSDGLKSSMDFIMKPLDVENVEEDE